VRGRGYREGLNEGITRIAKKILERVAGINTLTFTDFTARFISLPSAVITVPITFQCITGLIKTC